MKSPSYWIYRAVCGLIRLFYPRPTLEGLEHLPEGGCVIVSNHAQMNGPIIADVYLPGDRSIWCTSEMMHLREVPAYAYEDFWWSKKPIAVRWLYKIASYAIAPLSVCLFNNARCIGVYRDGRILGTLRETIKRLKEGARIVIFPECPTPRNSIVYTFQEGFVDLGRLFFRQTGQILEFVPMYVAPSLKKVLFGPPVAYDPAAPAEVERQRVCDALSLRITDLAESLPRHRVVPYLNMRKRDYPYNRPDKEASHE